MATDISEKGVETIRNELDPVINMKVERFKTLEENSQIRCKSAIKSFIRTTV